MLRASTDRNTGGVTTARESRSFKKNLTSRGGAVQLRLLTQGAGKPTVS